MAPRENLVPDVISDVNGKVTTVYRKPLLSVAKEFTPLFPPVVANMREERLLGLKDKVAELIGLDEPRDLEALSKSLRYCSTEFLEHVDTALDSDDANFTTSLAGFVFGEEREEVVRECIAFAPRLGLDDMGEAFTLVRSLKNYKRFSGHRDLSLAPEDVQEDCVSLMGLTRLLAGQDVNESSAALEYWDQSSRGLAPMPVVIDHELIDFALESKESLKRIQNVIRDYSTAEPNIIKGILNGIAPTLAAGSL